MLDKTFSLLPRLNRSERLLPELPSRRAARWLFALVFVLVALVHVLLVSLFLTHAGDAPVLPPMNEVPVEVIVEPPPAPEPPPPEEKKPEEPKPQEKQKPPEPPKPQYEQSLKPAFDAPRAPNQDQIEREAPHKETQAPEQEQKQSQQAPAEAPAAPDTPTIAPTPSPERQEQTTPVLPEKDDADAEAIKKELQQKEDKIKANAEAARVKQQLLKDQQKAAMAKQLAALKPSPSYTVGSKSKVAPVSGGTENTTYLSVLFGIIMKHMVDPHATRASPGTAVIFFALDDNGNIIHTAIEKTSGFPDIDQQTIDAVKRAGPFPPPPRDLPHRFFFSRDVDRGR